VNLIRNKKIDENTEEKDNSNLILKQVGEYQVTYHFNGNRTLEDGKC